MQDLAAHCPVALIQTGPEGFTKEAALAKALGLIREAGRQGAGLIVLPELLIPGYPYGLTYGFSVGRRTAPGRADWLRYYQASILCPGPECEALGRAAAAAKAYVSIGVSERSPRGATLYNTNLIFTPRGELAAVHRKLKPTGAERCLWGEAQQGYFPVVDSPWGPLGCLICWESYMPLARLALYEKGITIYISCNTNDNPEWQDTIKHIALEGHVFFLNCDQYLTKAMYPADLACQEELAALPELLCRGGSCVVDPYGHYVTEPLWDREAIIYADLDLEQVVASRMEFEAAGHYARPDVCHFSFEDK